MAKRILGLEVSFAELRYVYLAKRLGGFILLKTGRFSEANFATIKDSDNLARSIQDLLREEGLTPTKICLTLSNDDFIIHQISPLKMPETELNKIIEDEMEDIPKFFKKEFDYIYASSKLDEQRLRILSCAVARDSLGFYIEAVGKTGLPLVSLQIAPLNLLEILYPKMRRNQAHALVVLDEHTSFMMIFRRNDCRLFFQMATGKEDLFAKGPMDKSTFLSWTEEMKRIIKSYYRELGAQAIEKIWFVWDEKNSKELDKFVGEELGIRTDPLKLEYFGSKEGELNPIFFLSLATPLAYLKGLKRKFDFRRFSRRIILEKAARKIMLLALVYMGILGILSGLVISSFILSKKNLAKDEKQVLQRITVLEKQTATLKNERDSYLGVKDRLLRQAAFVAMLNRISWSKIFATISTVMPKDVSLSLFDVSEAGEIKLEGATFSIDSVAQMIRKINAVAFLENVQFNFLQEKEIDKIRIVEFGILTRLKSK